MLLEVHFTVKGNPNHLQLLVRPQLAHAEFDFEESADLGEMLEPKSDSLAKLDKFRLGESFTPLKVVRQVLIICVHENVDYLQKLLLENHLAILGEYVEDVPNDMVFVVCLLGESPHNHQERIPFEVIGFIGVEKTFNNSTFK